MDPVAINHVVELARANAWIPLLALVVGAIVRVGKNDALVAKIPLYFKPENRAVWALALGVVGAAVDRLAAGGTWYDAIAGGLVAGSAAIAGHEIIVNKLRRGRDFGVKKTPPPSLPWDNDSQRPEPPTSKRTIWPGAKLVAVLGLTLAIVMLTACPGAGKVCTALDLAAKACDLILVKMKDGTEVLVPRKQIEDVALRVQAASRPPLDPNPYLRDGGAE